MKEINISKNYPPAWEGETKGGIKKRIYAIVGHIAEITYRRFKDSEGFYLNDSEGNELLIERDYEK